jgi:hypothetical protein
MRRFERRCWIAESPLIGKVSTMSVSLESLEMGPQELQSCRDAVQKMAYFNWLDAGCPASGQLEFWLKAQRDWIEHNYVPRRALDGSRPGPDADAPGPNRFRAPRPKSRRRGRAAVEAE